jgi:short-subunit dehydrogenase
VDFRGSHVVITGASRGIGASLAREVTGRGARVTLLARSEGPLKQLADELDGLALPIDLASAEQLENIIERIEDNGGPITALINNAAMAVAGEFVAQSAQQARDQVLTNLCAPAELCRQVIPRMIERGGGNVVAVSSVAAEVALRNVGSYASSKAGLNQLFANLQRELARTPVHVTLALLGEVLTDMVVENRRDPVLNRVADRVGKMGSLQPEHVARRLADALEHDRHLLIMPPVLKPMYHIRQLPSRFSDLLTRGIE